MKKLLIASFLTFAFASCSSTIDKKVNIAMYSADIKEIKSSSKDYSDSDFIRASRDMDQVGFSALANRSTDITYRQLLDSARAHRLRDATIINKYYADLKAFNEIITVKVDSVEEIGNGTLNYYVVERHVTNNGKQMVTGIEGQLIFKDPTGSIIIKPYIKYIQDIKPGETFLDTKAEMIDDEAAVAELKQVPFARMKYEWQPFKISFANGIVEAAPVKPGILDLQ